MPTGLCSVYGHRGTSRLTHHTVAKLRSYNGGGYSMDTYPTLQPSRRRDEEPHHRHHHLLVINVTSLATDNVFDASAELLLWTIEGPSASGLLASYPCLINMPPAHRPASVPHNSGHPSGQLGDWFKMDFLRPLFSASAFLSFTVSPPPTLLMKVGDSTPTESS